MASKESQLYCATKVSVFNGDNHNHMFSMHHPQESGIIGVTNAEIIKHIEKLTCRPKLTY